MPITALTMRVRSLASRAGLASGLLVLLATSAPPSWQVRDETQITMPKLEPGDRLHRIATVHLHLTTPRGTWPLHLIAGPPPYSTAWFEGKNAMSGAGNLVWKSSCAKIDCTKPRGPLDSYSGSLETVCEQRVTECAIPTIEVRCDSGPCVLDYDVALHLRAQAVYSLEEHVYVTASFAGGIEGDAVGCQDKDSSTDSESAPAGLKLSLKVGRIVGDPSDPAVATGPNEVFDPAYPMTVPDAGRDAATHDAATNDAAISDAAIRVSDAQVSDAQVSDAQVSDAQVSDAGTKVPGEGGL